MTETTHADTVAGPRTEVIAFTSPVSGSGQTSVVANTAWVLASSGKRVLVLDCGASAPLVGDYLRPFPQRIQPVDEAVGQAVDLLVGSDRRLSDVTAERFALPTGEPIEVVQVHRHLDGARAVRLPAERGSGANLGHLLQQTRYDYVLVDAPSAVASDALIQLAYLCDAVALCFRAHRRVYPEAVEMARTLLDHAQVRLRTVALPAQIARQDPRRAAEQLEVIRSAFAEVADRRSGDGQHTALQVVEMPHHAYDVYEEYLAILLDEGEASRELLNIVGALTGGAVTDMPTVDPRWLARYRQGFSPDQPAVTEVVCLIYVPADRRWVDWIATQLRRAGVTVRRQPVLDGWQASDDPDVSELAIVGDGPMLAEPVRQLVERTLDPQTGRTGPRLSRLRITDEVSRAGGPPTVDLADRDEESCIAELLAHFELLRPTGTEDTAFRHRFPGRPATAADLAARVVNNPAANPLFAGRADDLEKVRDHFLNRRGAAVLVGPPGIGKSELAREYAQRFADDYDVVWWIPAGSHQSIDESVRELSRRLPRERAPSGLPHTAGALAAWPSEQAGGGIRTVTASLAERGSHYLLIYDNLENLAVLDELPIDGVGHVLVTAQERPRGTGPWTTIEVGRLGPHESVALLRSFVPDLTREEAGAVAEVLEHLPLALRMAGAWINQTVAVLMEHAPASVRAAATSAITRLRGQVEGDRPEHRASDDVLHRVWWALDSSARRTWEGRLAVSLAELAAFLAPERIGLELVRSAPMVAELVELAGDDAASLAPDPIDVDAVIWTGVRFGIFDVSWAPHGVLRMHRALQAAVRDSLSGRCLDRQRRVQRALSGYAPTAAEPDGPEARRLLSELQHHLPYCDAERSTDPAVRMWVVRQVRHMQLQQLTAVNAAALRIADRAVRCWREDPGIGPDDRILQCLEVERANILRWRSEYAQARDIDDRVRRRQRELGAAGRLRPLIAVRGLGGDVRALGGFERAKSYDGVAYRGLYAAVGEDHTQTLMAAHNYALSAFLDGDVHTAVLTERALLHRRRRLFGTADRYTWWSAANLGAYQRELGDCRGSLDTLRTARAWLVDIFGVADSFEDFDALRVIRSLAVTTRRVGDAGLSKDYHSSTLRVYERLVPRDHPDVWSCRLALAADHHAMRDSGVAVDIARRCLERYLVASGTEHPFTGVVRMNLAVYLRGAGLLDEARAEGDHALRILRGALRDGTHPWILAAMVNQAGNAAAQEDFAEAAELAETAFELCAEDLVPGHPYTRAAGHDFEVARAARDGHRPPPGAGWLDIDIDIPQA